MQRSELETLLSGISPLDDLEREHRADVLAWIRDARALYRIRKPDVPAKHLVAYFALVDVDENAVLLVDHINAQLWLPTGGHVGPDEDPRDTVTRELAEELGIAADLVGDLSSNPLFVTVTTTTGLDAGHVDVSLWYAVAGSIAETLQPDPGEFKALRWWPLADVLAADPDTLDPHLPRFVTKLQRDLARSR